MAHSRKLRYHVHVPDEDGTMQVFGPDDDVPAWARKKIDSANFEDADGDVVEEEVVEPPANPEDGEGDGDTKAAAYDQLLKADLEAEVESRNAGRDDADRVVVKGNGNKADLVKALKADDKAQAANA